MSRGHGYHQRWILERLAAPGIRLVPLSGNTRSQTSALLRAAKKLEQAGRVVIVRAWPSDRRQPASYAALPGATLSDGRPVQALHIEPVPAGTGSAFPGSYRHLAGREGVSVSTVWRDLNARAGGDDSPQVV